MSQQPRSPTKPDYYYTLNCKQKRNWRRNNKKIEINEELRSAYPPYHPSSNMIVFHLHHQTEIGTIEELIKKAEQTELYALDTESQSINRQNYGALIQIQMINSVHCSTVILIETNFLPNPQSLHYQKMKKLWSTIFSNGHKILSWGSYENEMKNFKDVDLINSGKSFKEINLQFWFQEWYDGKAHPERESRDHETGFELELEASDDDDIFGYDGQIKLKENKSINEWSLQAAVCEVFNKFLDKIETQNYWQCGIDLQLGTWKQQLFSKKQYDPQLEQEQRLKMIEYAVHDCTVLPELYFHMYPEKLNTYQKPTTSNTYHEPTTSSRILYINKNDELSDISEDELIKILRPKFDKQKSTVAAQDDEQPEQVQTQTIAPISSEQQKKQRQRGKNEKFKLKKKYNPEFQNKILRPMYYRYNYRKVRAQLLDDNVFTTHQITINKDRTEVMIKFRSNEEKERAKSIIRINYFSREQYIRRWSGR